MSDTATTVAAWVGAGGILLTWLVKLLGFVLRRRTRVEVRLLDGPKLKVVNKGEITVDIQPLNWGGRWETWGESEGAKYVQDSEGNYIRLSPGAELTLALLPDRDSYGGTTLTPETASQLIKTEEKPLRVCRRDGKLLQKVVCRDIKERLRKCLDEASQ